MNPSELAAYLKVLRDAGVASAEVVTGALNLRVVFEPGVAPVPQGDALTPGAWKGPSSLDRDPLADEEGRLP